MQNEGSRLEATQTKQLDNFSNGTAVMLAGSKRPHECEDVEDYIPKRPRPVLSSTQESHSQLPVPASRSPPDRFMDRTEVQRDDLQDKLDGFPGRPEGTQFQQHQLPKTELWFWRVGIRYGGIFHVETTGPYNMKFCNLRKWKLIESMLSSSMGSYSNPDNWGRPVIKVWMKCTSSQRDDVNARHPDLIMGCPQWSSGFFPCGRQTTSDCATYCEARDFEVDTGLLLRASGQVWCDPVMIFTTLTGKCYGPLTTSKRVGLDRFALTSRIMNAE